MGGRRGISTVLGAIISVGILFSVIFPLILFQQQVAAAYNQAVTQRRLSDAERLQEQIALTLGVSATGILTVRVTNFSPSVVSFAQLLVFDRVTGEVLQVLPGASLPQSIQPGATSSTISTGVALAPNLFVKVLTTRGNVVVGRYTPLPLQTSSLQLSLDGGITWQPLYGALAAIQTAAKNQLALIKALVTNSEDTALTLSTASTLFFLAPNAEVEKGKGATVNPIIVARLTSGVTIAAGTTAELKFRLDTLAVQLEDALRNLLTSGPITLAGIMTLATSTTAPRFVSTALPVDALLLTGA